MSTPLTNSNEPNFISNALLVAKEYFHFKLSNVTKRATVACAQCASRTAVIACSQCASRTEAPSNGLKKYHRRERTEERTNPHSHMDFLNLIIDCFHVEKLHSVLGGTALGRVVTMHRDTWAGNTHIVSRPKYRDTYRDTHHLS